MVQSTTIDRFASKEKPVRSSIMLIEDNSSLRDSLAEFLEEEGYEVDQCVDVHEALVLLELGHTPDLIMVDDAGSHDAGWIARLRSVRDARAARVPLITLCAGGLSMREEESEVDALLAKPIQPDRLLSTVSRLLVAAEEDRVSARALELQRLNSLGGLSAGLASELNDPVSFVVGNLEMARKKCHELGQRLERQELSLLQDIERLIQHGLRGASRVAEVVRNSASIPIGEGGRTGAIDVKFERSSSDQGAGFGPASFAGDTRVRPAPVDLRAQANESDAPPEHDRSTRRARILVIDDEQLMCELLGAMLSDDHDVVTLSSAREALARITSGESFDLILCDLMMPELTGMDLHAELSRLRPEQAARMVFMTGGTFTDRAQQFLAEHGRVQLQKPFRHDELLGLVSSRLEELKRTAQTNLH